MPLLRRQIGRWPRSTQLDDDLTTQPRARWIGLRRTGGTPAAGLQSCDRGGGGAGLVTDGEEQGEAVEPCRLGVPGRRLQLLGVLRLDWQGMAGRGGLLPSIW